MNAFAKTLRQQSTDAEKRLWHLLRARQIEGFKFRRQHPLGAYIVDFVCLERGLVVEADGGQHAEDENYDAERSEFLKTHGLRVLRFWNNEIFENIDDVLATIQTALLQANPSPQPSPPNAGEREQSKTSISKRALCFSPAPLRGEGKPSETIHRNH